jgi:hypothetical protein
MSNIISLFFLLAIKYLSKIFYNTNENWNIPKNKIDWDKIKLIVFLNHTSLFEFLYINILPNKFLYKLSRRMVAPAASKTLDRPIVGLFFKLFSPGLISITRKRDDSWTNFLESIYEDSVILIAPEGRMKRENGLDAEGNEMTVKSGVVELIKKLKDGSIVFAYSGGLHHVNIPDKHNVSFFKTIKINVEILEIEKYKNSFNLDILSEAWNSTVLADLQNRLETKIPL